MARRDRGNIPAAGYDRVSNEARRPFARKPSGRRVFWPGPSLAQPLQPAVGMLGPRRLGPAPKSLAAGPRAILKQALSSGSGVGTAQPGQSALHDPAALFQRRQPLAISVPGEFLHDPHRAVAQLRIGR